MPSNITIDDGASTPVSHQFVPMDRTDTLTTWVDPLSDTPRIGQPQITLSVPFGDNAVQVKAKVVLPILETVAGDDSSGFTPAPRVAYTLIGKLEFVLPNRCTEADRNNILAFVTNLAADGTIVDAVVDQLRPL